MNTPLVRLGLAVALASACAAPAFAQTATDTQRDVSQQRRIESGLQSGQLGTREAGRLEAGEARVERIEADAGRDGNVSAREQARITAAQDRESRAIHAQKHDAQRGDPASASSRRLQADVRRQENQQARILDGEQSGALTTREASRLERGQARTDRAVARAARDGHVDAAEQGRLQAREDRQGRRIFRKKHNATAA